MGAFVDGLLSQDLATYDAEDLTLLHLCCTALVREYEANGVVVPVLVQQRLASVVRALQAVPVTHEWT